MEAVLFRFWTMTVSCGCMRAIVRLMSPRVMYIPPFTLSLRLCDPPSHVWMVKGIDDSAFRRDIS